MATLRLNEENIEGKVGNVKYDEDGLPLAKNHAGWNVEKLTHDGWKPIFKEPCQSKSDARTLMRGATALNPSCEYRIYEALS